ncbi:tRNA (N(6)-L-threonylcarbamoyladenosine(37)-C(2))-methylthiotransferase MtaB [Spirochaetia bacterium]|nr:tRNA (N(6)-L-threonylcarbamoyladenosine(37)-C(2))-methylthiotransferase MtaB [Spirochaetia bacterium]
MLSVSFYTLGCKLNQLETESLAAAFREAGFSVRHGTLEPLSKAVPDLVIINTCTVTSRAEQKARRLIRLCLRRGSVVIVTGCYTEITAQAGLDQTAALFVVPGPAKDSLLDLPRLLAETIDVSKITDAAFRMTDAAFRMTNVILKVCSRTNAIPQPFRFEPETVFHSRPFLKIQDGCDRRCAYCRIPLARGKSISLEAPELIRRLTALEAAGKAEAVITGVNICQYRESGGGLAELLSVLLENTSRISLRLSSLEPEPGLFTEAFFKVLSHKRIRNHFHLSVQSGSDTILTAMSRPYTRADILGLVEKLREIKDDPFLGCDIITGFPGESEKDFEKTLSLCAAADFAWIHGFPYSRRPGTSAAVMKGQVNQRIAGKRLTLLTGIASLGKKAYIRRWLGKTVEAAAIDNDEADPRQGPENFPRFFPLLTDNYIRVLAASEERLLSGSAYRCILTEEAEGQDYEILGKVVK